MFRVQISVCASGSSSKDGGGDKGGGAEDGDSNTADTARAGVGMGTRHSAGAAALAGAGVGVEPPAAEAGRHLRRRGFRRSGSGLPDLRAFAAAVSMRFRAFRRFRSEVHSLRLISQSVYRSCAREQCSGQCVGYLHVYT